MTIYQGLIIVCDGLEVFPRYYAPEEQDIYARVNSSGWEIRRGKKPLRVVGSSTWTDTPSDSALFRDLGARLLRAFRVGQESETFWTNNFYPHGYPSGVVDLELGVEHCDTELSDRI